MQAVEYRTARKRAIYRRAYEHNFIEERDSVTKINIFRNTKEFEEYSTTTPILLFRS